MTHETRTIEALVLVFDTDWGPRGVLISSVKKLFQVNGRDSLGVAIDYLHREELPPVVAKVVGNAMPCVLAKTAKGHELLLSRDVLRRCQGDIDDFRERLRHQATRLGLALAAQTRPSRSSSSRSRLESDRS